MPTWADLQQSSKAGLRGGGERRQKNAPGLSRFLGGGMANIALQEVLGEELDAQGPSTLGPATEAPHCSTSSRVSPAGQIPAWASLGCRRGARPLPKGGCDPHGPWMRLSKRRGFTCSWSPQTSTRSSPGPSPPPLLPKSICPPPTGSLPTGIPLLRRQRKRPPNRPVWQIGAMPARGSPSIGARSEHRIPRRPGGVPGESPAAASGHFCRSLASHPLPGGMESVSPPRSQEGQACPSRLFSASLLPSKRLVLWLL